MRWIGCNALRGKLIPSIDPAFPNSSKYQV